jgi:hypothetical protein
MFKRGEHLGPPYVEQRASDSDKLAALTTAYAAYRNGTLEELPNLSDVFLTIPCCAHASDSRPSRMQRPSIR